MTMLASIVRIFSKTRVPRGRSLNRVKVRTVCIGLPMYLFFCVIYVYMACILLCLRVSMCMLRVKNTVQGRG